MLVKLFTTLLPVYCHGCEREGDLICDDCRSELVPRTPSCFYCNRLSPGGRTCPSCYAKTGLSRIGVAYRYEGLVEQLVRSLKYDGAREVASVLAGEMINTIKIDKLDLVTFVASDGVRYRQRGYNQARLLAREISRQGGLPMADLLVRQKHTGQIGLNRKERFVAVKGDFLAKNFRLINDQRILLVDDVLTTGATMCECARVLRAAGARSVVGVVAAKK